MTTSKAEYDAQKVEFEALLDVYRTKPDEKNRTPYPWGHWCGTIWLRENADLRNYLITCADLGLKAVPQKVTGNRAFELWKEAEDPHRVFYFFGMLFGETEQLNKLRELGYVMVRNGMGRDWGEYDHKEAEMEAYFALEEAGSGARADERILDLLLAFVQVKRRVCPQPQRWYRMWKMLPARERLEEGWRPVLPPILGAWRYTSDLEKQRLLREHIEYAARHGVLRKVDAFLRNLVPNQWHTSDDTERRG
jgi:hypothetical protein